MFGRALIPLVGVVCLSGCLDIFDDSDPAAVPEPAPLAKQAQSPRSGAAQPAPDKAPSSDSAGGGEAPDGRSDGEVAPVDPPSTRLPNKSARRRRRRPRKRYASTKPRLAQADSGEAGTQTKQPSTVDPSEGGAEPDKDGASVSVTRLVISSGVSGREPVGAATSFAAGAQRRIYAFVEVNNGSGEDSAVTVAFYRDGARQRGGIKMKVGASRRWRTWATTRHATKPGTWHAVVRGPEGKVLARTSFLITAPKAAEPSNGSAGSNGTPTN